MDKLLEFYWDDELIESRVLNNSSDQEQSLRLRDKDIAVTHGYHKVKMVLSQYIEGQKGYSVDPLEFEMATTDPDDETPIIWLGSYKNSYYNYDDI